MSPRALSLTALTLAAAWVGCSAAADAPKPDPAPAAWCGDSLDAAADEALFAALTQRQWVFVPMSRWSVTENLVLSPTGPATWSARSDVPEIRPRGDWNFLRAPGDEDRGMLCFGDGAVLHFQLDGETLRVGSSTLSGRPLTTPPSGKARRADLPRVGPSDTVAALTAHAWHISHPLDAHRHPDWVRLTTDGRYTTSHRGGACTTQGRWSLFGSLRFHPDDNHCRTLDPAIDLVPVQEALADAEARIAQAVAEGTCTEANVAPPSGPGPLVTVKRSDPAESGATDSSAVPCSAEDRATLQRLVGERNHVRSILLQTRAAPSGGAPQLTDEGLFVGNILWLKEPRGASNRVFVRGLTSLAVDLSVRWQGDLSPGEESRWEVTLVRGQVKSHSPETDNLTGLRVSWQRIAAIDGSFQRSEEPQVLWEGTLAPLDWTPGTPHTVPVLFTLPPGLGELSLTVDVQFTSRPSSHTVGWVTGVDAPAASP